MIQLSSPADELRTELEALRKRLRELEGDVERSERRLREFEERYGMSSEEFLGRYSSGRLSGDEYQEWLAEISYLRIQRQAVEALKRAVEGLSRELASME